MSLKSKIRLVAAKYMKGAKPGYFRVKISTRIFFTERKDEFHYVPLGCVLVLLERRLP